MANVNLTAAWVLILLGFLSGAGMGLFFRNAKWLGGYTSWPRRMLRLGHISFFGMAFINLAFFVSAPYLPITSAVSTASALLLLAAIAMPTICLLSAFREKVRHTFFIPVGSLLTAASLLVFATLPGCATTPQHPGATDQAAIERTVQQAYELRLSGRTLDARAALEKIVDENPDYGPAWFELARVQFYCIFAGDSPADMKETLSEAGQSVDRAVKLQPDNPRYHYWAGHIKTYGTIAAAHEPIKWVGMPFQMQAALNHYERVLALRPDDLHTRQVLMGLYDRSPWFMGGNKRKAIQFRNQLANMDPVYGVAATCELHSDESEWQKLDHWQALLEQHPDNPRIHAGLAAQYASALRAGGDQQYCLQKALEHARRAVSLDAAEYEILLRVGDRVQRQRQWDSATALYREFLQLLPPPPAGLRAYALNELALIERRRENGNEVAAADLAQQARRTDQVLWGSHHLPPADLWIAP